jgi:hypothetical protein
MRRVKFSRKSIKTIQFTEISDGKTEFILKMQFLNEQRKVCGQV